MILLMPGIGLAQSVPLPSPVIAAAGPASLEEVYTVRTVAVDETADTTAAARDNALVTARRAAFNRLLRRIVLPQDRPRAPIPSDDELIDMVSSFEVANEKSSAKRYLANLTLRFNPKNVRAQLRRANIPINEIGAEPVLLLPVYADASGQYLWGPTNPWRDALRTAVAETGSGGDRLVPVYLPQGDDTDTAALSVEQAIIGDPQRLAMLRQRYGVSDILLLHARASATAMDITVRRLGAAEEEMRIDRIEGAPGEAPAQILYRGALQLVQGVQDEWMQQSKFDDTQAASLEVHLPLTSLNDWLAMQQRLSEVAGISNIEILAISTTSAYIKLHYVGDMEKLTAALAERQLQLAQEADHWLLRAYSP